MPTNPIGAFRPVSRPTRRTLEPVDGRSKARNVTRACAHASTYPLCSVGIEGQRMRRK